jgi:hypothetical protein
MSFFSARVPRHAYYDDDFVRLESEVHILEYHEELFTQIGPAAPLSILLAGQMIALRDPTVGTLYTREYAL